MTYVMSDLHGRYDLYKKMLEKINLSDVDTLYILGDFVDRGKEGLRILLDMAERDNVFGIMGNHDYIASYVLKSTKRPLTSEQLIKISQIMSAWLNDGGMTTYDEYMSLTQDERRLAMRMIDSLSYYDEVVIDEREFILCHAGIRNYSEDTPLYEYDDTDFIDAREDYSKPKFAKNGKYLVTGHTPTIAIDENFKGRIYKNHDHIAVDCGAVWGYGLGCLCLDTMEEFYVK